MTKMTVKVPHLSEKIILIFLILLLFSAGIKPKRVLATPAGDNIIISEVEYNPSGSENEAEWFELFNPTKDTIDIGGWTIQEGYTYYYTFPLSTTIASGDYLLVTNDTTAFQSEHSGITPDLDMSGTGCYSATRCIRLNNSGNDELTLRDGPPATGNDIDYVIWGPGGYASANEGESIYRTSSVDTDTSADWGTTASPSPGSGTLTVFNIAPTDIELDGANTDNVNENRLIGAEIGTLTTIDADAGDSHTYSLVAGAGDTDNGSFTINGDKLLLNTSPNFEAQNSYSIRIQTDDGFGGTYAEAFTISVVDITTENDTATTEVWKLDTAGNYTLSNSARIEITTGIARASANVPVFDHYWALDEASWNGTPNEVTDSAGNGDGTSTGANTIAGGIINRGGNFDRTSQDYVDFGTNIGNPGINDFSYGLWFKTTNSANMSLMARSVYSGTNGRYTVLLRNGRIRALIDLGPNYIIDSTANNYNDDAWHFIVVNVDRDGNLSLYIDNTLESTTNISAQSSFNYSAYIRNLYIGAYNDPDGIGTHNTFGYYDGDLDEAFFINRQLTTTEINDMWNGGTGGRLTLEGYASNNPYIIANQTVNYPSTLVSFNEILSQNNEGVVRYQISSDAGTTWRYWDGSAWVPTTDTSGAETSTASQINANIASFSLSGGDFTWRAFLDSDGTQKVELDQVEVTFTPNQPPTDIKLDGADTDSVDENRLIGAEIGILSTTDADVADVHTYALVAGAGDADNGKFSISGNQVLVNAGIDFESQNSYSIRVQSDDGNGGTYAESLTITAIDIVHEDDNATTEVWKLETAGNYTLSDASTTEFHTGIGRLSNSFIFDHYWMLDETNWGVVEDSADNGDGTAYGATPNQSGKIETAGAFVRANKEYLDFGTNTANPGANDFSYGLWFKTTNTAQMSLMARSVYSSANGRYALFINNGVITALLDRGPNRNISSAMSYNDGNWHLAIATIDSDGQHRLYIDDTEIVGIDISPEAGFDFTGYDRNLYLGAYNDNTGLNPHGSLLYYDGNLDEAFFINRLLTATEINDIYNAGAGKRLREYANDKPYIEATDTVAFTRSLDSFSTYLSQNNEGAVNYQVSSDDGVTWQYWDGSAWTSTTATDGSETSTSADINTNINTLDTDGGIFTWRAYLESDGTQKVELDHIDVTYDAAIVEFSIDSSDSEDSGGNFPQLLVEGTLLTSATLDIRDLGTGSATQGAGANDDYVFSTNPQTITIPAGTYSSATPIDIPSFALSITNDNVDEANETINFQIENPSGILIDDANGDSSTNTQQTYTITNDDTAGITVSTISGDTGEDGTTATFTIVLDSQPTNDVSVGLSSDDTSEGTVAPTSVTFTFGNWDTPQTITVTGVDDAIVDGTIAYQILTAAATSADGNYNGINPDDVDVNNVDNDTAGITVSTISGDTGEDGTTATFTIVLDSQPTNDVSVGLSSDDTSEGTVAPTSVTFTFGNWDTPQTITVTGVDDAIVDGTIAYQILTAAATSADGNYNGIDPADVDVNNVDNEIPLVVFGANTIPANGVTLETGPSQILIEYNMEVKSGGNTVPGAADNPDNYILVEEGANGSFDTVDCNSGFDPRDTLITIDTASYSNANPYIATLNINGNTPLRTGEYRLYICGTTSIENLFGTKLNNGLSDTHLEFTVVATATDLPATGFPRGSVSALPKQPAAKAYTETAMMLSIPKLGVNTPIIGVPQSDNGWNVTWLGNSAGYLAGTAFPTWAGNTVITGHVWDSFNQPGVFADLKTLKYGDLVQIHAWDQTYTYEVRESKLVTPKNINAVLQSEKYDWVTLVTCEFYNPFSGDYLLRRSVRAVLISVK